MRLRRPFMLIIRHPRNFSRHLCASTGALKVPGVGELHEFCFF
ncbi:hypothetical protein EUBVEN_02343 [Eubacterium ventriosum ATCC 27560]|uniref:Uncharacterized protein n=1 Tax=Eubacterium ventriosum ATCC 27560 TaxID=411463 RepID=A5Z9E8_9FIRM|nr:hypothetical protein EUBVEN_02343 [Eubacterium ventriosum ATCC 27560]